MLPKKPIFSLLILSALCLSSCATQSIDQQILNANRAVTLVEASTDVALVNHAINADQAAAVSAIAHQVNPLLDSARKASAANNPDSANKTLNLVNSLLAGLQAYVPPTPPASK